MVKKRSCFSHVLHQLQKSMTQHRLLPRCERILIALSGGQDSLALTELLHHMHVRRPWARLSIAHCDHRWPLDVGNCELVRNHAERLNLNLHVIDAAHTIGAVGLSENAAREWRYGELGRLASDSNNRYDIVVTAHTRTDLAETVVYNLCHGAGADGLSALTWTRQLCDGVRLVRPMLDISREETANLCHERKLDVWHDVYNKDVKYARNRIRKHVMPVLKQCVNKEVEKALARTAHLLREDALQLQIEADNVFHDVVVSNKKNKNNDGHANIVEENSEQDEKLLVTLCKQTMKKLNVPLQRRVIRRALREFVGLQHEGKIFAQVETVRSLIDSDVGSSIPSLHSNATAFVETEDFITIRRQDTANTSQPVSTSETTRIDSHHSRPVPNGDKDRVVQTARLDKNCNEDDVDSVDAGVGCINRSTNAQSHTIKNANLH